jgi:DNA helicase MCM8
VDPLPPGLLRKYLAYARRWVHPALGPAARRVLQDFYMQLRAKPQGEVSGIAYYLAAAKI